MAWKFDATAVDIVWVVTPEQIDINGVLDLGPATSDITVDTGNRTNDTAVLDQGTRVI